MLPDGSLRDSGVCNSFVPLLRALRVILYANSPNRGVILLIKNPVESSAAVSKTACVHHRPTAPYESLASEGGSIKSTLRKIEAWIRSLSCTFLKKFAGGLLIGKPFILFLRSAQLILSA